MFGLPTKFWSSRKPKVPNRSPCHSYRLTQIAAGGRTRKRRGPTFCWEAQSLPQDAVVAEWLVRGLRFTWIGYRWFGLRFVFLSWCLRIFKLFGWLFPSLSLAVWRMAFVLLRFLALANHNAFSKISCRPRNAGLTWRRLLFLKSRWARVSPHLSD